MPHTRVTGLVSPQAWARAADPSTVSPTAEGSPFVLWGLSARNAAPVGRRNPFRWSDHFMRKVSYLVSLVGLLLVFTVKIGQAHSDAMRRRRMQRIWAHKRDEWLRNLPA